MSVTIRKEAKKQSKFKHYILTPIRILKKAKELYVKGVVDCAGALGVGTASSVHQTRQKEERRIVGNQTRNRIVGVGYKYNRMKMSYHTEMRKMGTIDEDKPCYFEEDQNASNSKPNLLYLYPRTRAPHL
ncbi:hypothetical protein CR513_11980, partial [Mucuna pruriens]